MLQNIQKIEGDPFETLKNFRKKNEKSKNKNFEPVSESRKSWKGRPLALFQTSVCCKISKKNLKGDPLETNKNSKKKSHSAEKTQRKDPIVSSGFVSYEKNGVTERGTLCTILNAPPIRLPVQ